MLIWTGFGFLAGLIPAAAFVLTTLLAERGGSASPAATAASLAATGAVSAALVWWIGRRLNAAPDRELIDAKTGERVVLRRRHTLFWIPMQWWAIPYLIFAAAVVAVFFLHPHYQAQTP